jgi:hypothetical protein
MQLKNFSVNTKSLTASKICDTHVYYIHVYYTLVLRFWQ